MALNFSFFTRVCLSIATIVVSVSLFWILESNKKKSSSPEEKQEKIKKRESENQSTIEERFALAAEESAIKTGARMRSSKKQLTKNEEEKLKEWTAELKILEERRRRASEEYQTPEVGPGPPQEDFGFGNIGGPFENQSQPSEFEFGRPLSRM